MKQKENVVDKYNVSQTKKRLNKRNTYFKFAETWQYRIYRKCPLSLEQSVTGKLLTICSPKDEKTNLGSKKEKET
jgi:hypothetical protein